MRMRQLEQIASAMLESQQSTVQILADHTRLLERIEDRLEQVQADLAFIKTILLRRGDAPESCACALRYPRAPSVNKAADCFGANFSTSLGFRQRDAVDVIAQQ